MNRWKPLDVDWKEFQNDLFSQVPFVGKSWNPKGIENFVERTIRSYLPRSMFGNAGFSPFAAAIDYDVFETHRSIFVRCRVPEDVSPRSLRFYANSRQLRIESGDHSEDITLPGEINPNRTIARYRQGVLEIRMPKVGRSEPFQEIFIRDGGK
ncbi:Hsp20/alpha crystallin family protein [Cohnella lubricantis]|uniref:Hsp20/alpha crystallin family protein n=1 Tax=Cohnella lubricantis TaxID=2163172 RepID=A0A841TAB3_9BACL|nr:Hsp20/alpha crystallin family protein [Cohnella lubricantis]MBB6678433.1 hypothetical protein [Cohnella lubricantis]MBP2116813.1 HSP20 family molecular chaperone IbpA [Cohnella lubricantis]